MIEEQRKEEAYPVPDTHNDADISPGGVILALSVGYEEAREIRTYMQ